MPKLPQSEEAKFDPRSQATSLPRHGQVKLTPTMSRMTTPISHWDAPGMGMAAHPGE